MKEIQQRGKTKNRAFHEAARQAREIWSILDASAKTRDPKVFPLCVSFARNVAMLHESIRGSEIALERFATDDDTEFSFDIVERGELLGYISKGWDEPGARLEDVLTVENADIPLFKDALGEILDICSARGVCFHFHPRDKRIEIELWTPIYIDALTPRGFFDALKSIEKCRKEIYALCPFER